MNNPLCRARRGFCLAETMLGGTILVALTLFLITLMSMITVHSSQDRLTYNAARAAANCSDPLQAAAAAANVVKLAQNQKSLIKDVQCTCNYVPNHRVEVALVTKMRLPAPVPFVSNVIAFRTDAIVPVVSSPIVRF